MAHYGYTAPLGAYMAVYGKTDSGSTDKKYRHLFQLLKHRVRLMKHLHKTKNSKKQTKLKEELQMTTSKIKHLKKLLKDAGVDTSQVEQAATSAAAAETSKIAGARVGSSGEADSGFQRRRLPRGARMRGHGQGRDQMGRRPPRGIQRGQMGEDDTASEMDAGQDHFRDPRKHRAGVAGQRGADGRRRQGPVAATEMPAAVEAEMVESAVSDIDDVGGGSSDVMSLAGIMDMFTGMDMKKALTYGALGLGVLFLLKNMKKR